MHLDDLLTDDAVLAELGHRIERLRLSRNISQAELARQAGVSRATIVRVENGKSVQMSTTVKLWRALDLLAAIDAALPERIESPIAALEREHLRRRHERQRATGRRPAGQRPADPATPLPVSGDTSRPFTWGDER
ncbi:MAG TPA: helix-turn-helix transcriptional regulator [Baekduia sp.]|uniref:helix-turn-helix transcriptional regulator n=1 Tax=Baekduia sp. TaxID=2600305 RepID=UPI002C3F9229|nr:helix-turn-helix transcriptional regulator [Baekduia sp.]HMJ34980.1 helix-turn-helix transcriptional regulator [Baekduia sp.]